MTIDNPKNVLDYAWKSGVDHVSQLWRTCETISFQQNAQNLLCWMVFFYGSVKSSIRTIQCDFQLKCQGSGLGSHVANTLTYFARHLWAHTQTCVRGWIFKAIQGLKTH